MLFQSIYYHIILVCVLLLSPICHIEYQSVSIVSTFCHKTRIHCDQNGRVPVNQTWNSKKLKRCGIVEGMVWHLPRGVRGTHSSDWTGHRLNVRRLLVILVWVILGTLPFARLLFIAGLTPGQSGKVATEGTALAISRHVLPMKAYKQGVSTVRTGPAPPLRLQAL